MTFVCLSANCTAKLIVKCKSEVGPHLVWQAQGFVDWQAGASWINGQWLTQSGRFSKQWLVNWWSWWLWHNGFLKLWCRNHGLQMSQTEAEEEVMVAIGWNRLSHSRSHGCHDWQITALSPTTLLVSWMPLFFLAQSSESERVGYWLETTVFPWMKTKWKLRPACWKSLHLSLSWPSHQELHICLMKLWSWKLLVFKRRQKIVTQVLKVVTSRWKYLWYH